MVGLYRAGRLCQSQMRADAIGKPLDFGVRAAHGGGGLAAAQGARQRRVKLSFLGTFVRQNPLGQQGMRRESAIPAPLHRGPLANRSALSRSSPMVSRSSSCSAAKRRSICSVSGGQRQLGGRVTAQCPQRIEDHRDVDTLLQQRTGCRRQPAQRGDRHRQQRQAHAHDGALHCDAPRPAGNVHRIGQPVERSVVNTMSAASEDAVAPRAPIATPTVAAASAGASLTPSPTITVTARSRFGAHRGDLVGRASGRRRPHPGPRRSRPRGPARRGRR